MVVGHCDGRRYATDRASPRLLPLLLGLGFNYQWRDAVEFEEAEEKVKGRKEPGYRRIRAATVITAH